MNTETFFQKLWNDYIQMAPQAKKIHDFFSKKGEKVINDHVAFRTFNLAPIRVEDLEPHFLALGYKKLESYEFPEKKLVANSYSHGNPDLPLIFCSQLKVEELSEKSRAIVRKMTAQISPEKVKTPEVFWAGRLWNAPFVAEYELLLGESEYAGWLAAIGLRVNHFTVAVHHLTAYDSVDSVLKAIESIGFPVNDSGGRVKGTPKELLEQGSTLADRIDVTFGDGASRKIPSCYYEFAKRYKDPGGKFYRGFIAASANKIFESTDLKKK